VVRTVTSGMAFAPGFAVSGLEGSGMSAAAMWRPTTAAASNSAVVNAAAGNPAQHQTVAISPAVRTRSRKLAVLNPKLNQLHTQKQYVVTTPDAGRGNKGTSPWGFPV
jgi:hypothetical protein